jgi:transposase-like protein
MGPTAIFKLNFDYDYLRTKENTMENANQDNASTKPWEMPCPKCGSTNIISVMQYLVGPPFNIVCKVCNHTWKHETKISFDPPQKLNFFQRLVDKIL